MPVPWTADGPEAHPEPPGTWADASPSVAGLATRRGDQGVPPITIAKLSRALLLAMNAAISVATRVRDADNHPRAGLWLIFGVARSNALSRDF
jgi:hypothetical protein